MIYLSKLRIWCDFLPVTSLSVIALVFLADGFGLCLLAKGDIATGRRDPSSSFIERFLVTFEFSI